MDHAKLAEELEQLGTPREHSSVISRLILKEPEVGAYFFLLLQLRKYVLIFREAAKKEGGGLKAGPRHYKRNFFCGSLLWGSLVFLRST